MPRLIGEKSNAGAYIFVGFLLGLAAGIAGMSEYTGVIDVVPRFGKQSKIIDSLRCLDSHELIVYTTIHPLQTKDRGHA